MPLEASPRPGTIIEWLWTESGPFDSAGTHHQLTGTICNPKPVQQPRPPYCLCCRSKATLRVVAGHADGATRRRHRRRTRPPRLARPLATTLTDRDPARITCSLVLRLANDEPAATRTTISLALVAGFRHLVLSLPDRYPDHVAHRVADEITIPSGLTCAAALTAGERAFNRDPQPGPRIERSTLTSEPELCSLARDRRQA
jgi:hypothetical protein